ncbi:MAG: hypothetical protein ACI9T8_000100 [Candidatus Saccharimonadales bacterium]|jgi:hypothetical protein
MKKQTKQKSDQATKASDRAKHFITHNMWSSRGLFGKMMSSLLVLALLTTSVAYGISYWYLNEHRSEPLVIGATFVPNYSRYFEIEPKETLQAMIDDLGIKRFRLVSYWNIHEPQPDEYDFSELDWQFDMIEAAGGEVALAIGLRQPRWPECHGPEWAMAKSVVDWTEDLKEYMGVTIDRYKNRDVLVEYQLENEFLLTAFGDCPDHSRERLVDEFNFVREKDPDRTLIVSRSNNAVPSWPVGEPRADKVGAAVYKRVWDKTVTKRDYEYPFPGWFYGFLAGATELTTGRESIVHELQMESWLPEDIGYDMRDAPLKDLYSTFGPDRVESRLQYAVDSGIKTIDMWGVEWWYQLKTQRDAPEIWDQVKETLADLDAEYN